MGRLAAALLALGLAAAAAAGRADEPPGRLWVALGGETFRLELALDAAARGRGLSGRTEIARDAGMLFVWPAPLPVEMVMRDCPVPIDVAFLDAEGTVLAVRSMHPEPPRAPGESPGSYERRLRRYASPAPAQFAIEVAGGRLAAIGMAPGDRVAIDTRSLVDWAR